MLKRITSDDAYKRKSTLFGDVYDIVRHIPYGKVTTYGTVASILGNRHLSRVVGYALHANPSNYITPCHRVVFKDGSLSESFAFGGSDVQREKLEKEGVVFTDEGKVDMTKHYWNGRNGL